MFCKFVSLQAAKLGGLIRADVTVVRFPAVIRGLADPLVLGLLVSCQAALLSGDVTALVASVLRVFFVLRWLDAAGLTSGVVHLVEAVPEKQTSTNEHFFQVVSLFRVSPHSPGLIHLLMLDHLVLRRRRLDRVLLH